MLSLDYPFNHVTSTKMLAFCIDRFGYLPEYDIEFRCFRIRFKTEEDMSFFLLYWSDKAYAIS